MGLKGNLGELPLADLVEMTSAGRQDRPPRALRREGGGGRRARVPRRPPGRRPGGELTRREGVLRPARPQDGAFDFDPAAELDDGRRATCPPSRCSWRACAASTRSTACAATSRRRPSCATSAGRRTTPLEARVLGYLGPGARPVGDIVEGLLVGGDADEYDALSALERLAAARHGARRAARQGPARPTRRRRATST